MWLLRLALDQWLDIGISVLIILITFTLGRWLVNAVLEKGVHRLTRYTRTTIDDLILDIVRPPLLWGLLLLGVNVAISRLDFLPTAWRSTIEELFRVSYLLVGFLFAWRFVDRFLQWYGRQIAVRTETELDEHLMPFFRRIALIALGLIALITLLSEIGVNVTAMVTTLGIGSLAVALAAQTALADAINGFLILMDRPFRVGDRIEIRDINTWGDVVDIGLRSSRIRTRDNRMVIIPNSIIGQSLVVNHSYPDTQYRIQVEVGIAYGSDLELARRTMIKAVRGVEGVLLDRPVEALFLAFGEFALIFRVRWWIESYQDTRRMFDRVNTAIYNALKEAGIEIPFPQRDVHHKVDIKDVSPLVRLLREEREYTTSS